jgi:predicted O-methyltransferase YrrM
MNLAKRAILWLLQKCGYSLLHSEVLERERRHLGELAARRGSLEMPAADQASFDEPQAGRGRQKKQEADRRRFDDLKAELEQLLKQLDLKIDILPLTRLDGEGLFNRAHIVDRKWLEDVTRSEFYRYLWSQYLRSYPSRSLMSSPSRALLYVLVRAMKPAEVVEIGTFFAGTTEVLARALWENGAGLVHTVDPFGGDRCPPIIKQWPVPLQHFVRYYAMNSMEFFNQSEHAGRKFDIVFIDGNHDFEFALFDLQMASRMIRTGGVIVMDNAEQSGPFWATLQFLSQNPGWTELGDAVEKFERSEPFATPRASVADTSFLVLQAPSSYALGEVPHSWGQRPIEVDRIERILFRAGPGKYRGTLNYHVILRIIQAKARSIDEYKRVGRVTLDMEASSPTRIEHPLAEPLAPCLRDHDGEYVHTVEIELAWDGDPRYLNIISQPEAL